jgi:DNA repair photolyase
MQIDVKEIQARSILTPQTVGSLSSHYDFSLNPYAGCAFKCSYCYVPKFPGKHDAKDWGNWVEVKMNAPELIRKDRLKVFGSKIFFSSATDPYQYLELKYRLTRRCLQELLRYQPAHITLHTRSHLILQDVDLLKQFGSRLQVGVSITTDNDAIRAEFEPNAPSIPRRIELGKTLKESGVRAYASVSPLLPCDAEQFIALLKPHINKAWVNEMNWLEVMNKPELLQKYEQFFAQPGYGELVARLRRAFRSPAERVELDASATGITLV